MVEVGGEDDDDENANRVPGEDDEPDMGGMDYGDEEELVPVKPRHAGLFGSDLSAVKY